MPETVPLTPPCLRPSTNMREHGLSGHGEKKESVMDPVASFVCALLRGRKTGLRTWYLPPSALPCSIRVLDLPPLPRLPPAPPFPPHSLDAPQAVNTVDESLGQPYSQELLDWFAAAEGTFQELATITADWHQDRLFRLRQSAAEARKHLWWPFTQHQLVGEADVAVIDSREGGRFTVYRPGTEAAGKDGVVRRGAGSGAGEPNGEEGKGEGAEVPPQQGLHRPGDEQGHDMRELRSVERMEGWFDASASWWTQGPDAVLQAELAREIGAALARYGHVMFPGNSHEPALECSKMLLDTVGRGGWVARINCDSLPCECSRPLKYMKYAPRHRGERWVCCSNQLWFVARVSAQGPRNT